MKIGVRVHDFGKSNAETLAKQAKEVGFPGEGNSNSQYSCLGNPTDRGAC